MSWGTHVGRNPLNDEARRAKRLVFLVHGRNFEARTELIKQLEAFDLKVLRWRDAASEAGGGSSYTGDIVDKGMRLANGVVVLLTPDDIGYVRPEFKQDRDDSHETQPTPQARLNVVFEAGMAMALGREHCVLVEIGETRRMSDIAGLNIIRLRDDIESRKDFAQRLRDAGFAVDTSGEEWRTAGDFDRHDPGRKPLENSSGTTRSTASHDQRTTVPVAGDTELTISGPHALFEQRERLFVVKYHDDTLSLMSTATGQLSPLGMFTGVTDIIVSPSHARIIVAKSGSISWARLDPLATKPPPWSDTPIEPGWRVLAARYNGTSLDVVTATAKATSLLRLGAGREVIASELAPRAAVAAALFRDGILLILDDGTIRATGTVPGQVRLSGKGWISTDVVHGARGYVYAALRDDTTTSRLHVIDAQGVWSIELPGRNDTVHLPRPLDPGGVPRFVAVRAGANVTVWRLDRLRDAAQHGEST